MRAKAVFSSSYGCLAKTYMTTTQDLNVRKTWYQDSTGKGSRWQFGKLEKCFSVVVVYMILPCLYWCE